MRQLLFDHRWILLALFGLIFLNYYPVLTQGFMIDDYLFLEGRWVGGYKGYLNFLTGNTSQHYSPLYFALNYGIFSVFRNYPLIISLINLVLFFIMLVGFFGLARLWTESSLLASLTVLFMALHPILGFPVAYKTANFLFYSAIFQQIALYYLWKYHMSARKSIRFQVISVTAAAMALLSHEWAILIPVYGLLVLCIFGNSKKSDKLRQILPHLLLSGLFFILYMTMAGHKVGFVTRFMQMNLGPIEYVTMAFHYLSYYMGDFFVPARSQFFMHQLNTLGRWNWIMAGTSLSLFGLFIGLILKNKLNKIFLFACLWFLLGWLPIPLAMLGHPSLGVVFEPHWLMFGSFGLFLATSYILREGLKRAPMPVGFALVWGICFGLFLTSKPLQKAMVNEKSFCHYWLNLYPKNHIALSTLGQIYYREGKYQEALEYYQILVDNSDGKHYQELNNIGLIYRDQGRVDLAEQFIRQALTLNPTFSAGWNNLGQLARDNNRPTEALEYFQKSLELDPFLPAARLNAVEMLTISHQPRLALEILSGIDLEGVKPFYREEAILYFLVLAVTLDDQPLEQRAQKLLKEHFASKPYRVRLAQRYLNVGLGRRAELLLREVVETRGAPATAYILLGSYYGNTENWQQAINIWREGKKHYPDEALFDQYISKAIRLQESGT